MDSSTHHTFAPRTPRPQPPHRNPSGTADLVGPHHLDGAPPANAGCVLATPTAQYHSSMRCELGTAAMLLQPLPWQLVVDPLRWQAVVVAGCDEVGQLRMGPHAHHAGGAIRDGCHLGLSLRAQGTLRDWQCRVGHWYRSNQVGRRSRLDLFVTVVLLVLSMRITMLLTRGHCLPSVNRVTLQHTPRRRHPTAHVGRPHARCTTPTPHAHNTACAGHLPSV